MNSSTTSKNRLDTRLFLTLESFLDEEEKTFLENDLSQMLTYDDIKTDANPMQVVKADEPPLEQPSQ